MIRGETSGLCPIYPRQCTSFSYLLYDFDKIRIALQHGVNRQKS